MRLLTKTGIISLLKENEKWLINEIRKRKPQHEADINKYAINVLFDLVKPKMQSKFEIEAYENGMSEFLLKKVASLYYRDMAIKQLLGRRKSINN